MMAEVKDSEGSVNALKRPLEREAKRPAWGEKESSIQKHMQKA